MINKKIKILIDSIGATPSPFYFLWEFISREVSFLEFVKKFNKSIKELDKKFWQDKMYDGIELDYPGLGFFDRNWNVREEKILEYRKSNYPFYTFHGCFEAFPRVFRGLYFNLASGSDYMKKAMESQIDVAASLAREKPIIIFHFGTAERGVDRKEALCNVLENLKFGLDYAKKKGVVLTVENNNWNSRRLVLGTSIEDFKYIFDKINDPNLGITFDWGHWNTLVINKEFRSKRDVKKLEHIWEFINKFSDKIYHCHVHYNTCHLNYNKPTEILKTSLFRKAISSLTFWMHMNQFMANRDMDFFDEHLPINKADKEILKTMDFLINKTKIKEYGYITLEFSPKKIFRIFPYKSNGAVFSDHEASLQIVREMIE